MTRPPAARQPVSLVVFDLDGTLIDSRQDIADAANDVLFDCGGPRLSDEAIGRMVGEGAATLVARAFAAAGVPAPPDALSRYLRCYDRRLLLHTRPYDGIEEVLEALRSRYAVAVLTNKPASATGRILAGLDLARHFDSARVLGGDGPHARKPDPEGLLALAAASQTAMDRVLMVGDSVIDSRTARAAGARSCIARYGFGFGSFSTDELAAVDHTIDRPRELIDWLI